MIIKGAFGFIIGKKKRLMNVQSDADLLWQILVREIYIILKHFNTTEDMKKAFENIKTTKNIPKTTDKERFRIFMDFESPVDENVVWTSLLHYCQSSYINILEAGTIVNHNEEKGLIFMLDLNKGIANYYTKDLDGRVNTINSATLEEIMNYEEMPTKTYKEIVDNMKIKFAGFYEQYLKIEEELKNLIKLKISAKLQNDVNIEDKVNKLIDDMIWEKKKLNNSRRVFYHRLKDLDLIEE